MKKNTKKALSGLMGASVLMTGAAAMAETTLGEYALTAEAVSKETTEKIANVQGTFSFSQDVLSPSEDVFNLYGTAVTGMCAKPAFAFEAGSEEAGDYYINVSGNMQLSKKVTLSELKSKTRTKVLACSCATGPAVVQAQVSGIPLSSILELAELSEQTANTLTVTGSDGYSVSMPLRYALDREAMIVYQVNGEQLAQNQRTQLWMPGAVAKYFARDVVEIEVSRQDAEPEVLHADAEQRAKVSIVNKADEACIRKGETVVFEGYADDCESAVAAVEFSMDGGETWTSCATEDATADRWVYWTFAVAPEKAGSYEMIVRARTADGTVSPLASTMRFAVAE